MPYNTNWHCAACCNIYIKETRYVQIIMFYNDTNKDCSFEINYFMLFSVKKWSFQCKDDIITKWLTQTIFFLGFAVGSLGHDDFAEMHLHPNPIFSIPSDNIYMTCMTGTQSGRIFLGGKDGCVYEVAYQVSVKWILVSSYWLTPVVSKVHLLVIGFKSIFLLTDQMRPCVSHSKIMSDNMIQSI